MEDRKHEEGVWARGVVVRLRRERREMESGVWLVCCPLLESVETDEV